VLRHFLTFAIVVGFLAGCVGQSTTPIYPIPQSASRLGSGGASPETHNPNELPEPPEVKSVDGVAKVDLTASINPATGLPALDFNGMHGVTPTIRVNPGDTIVVNVDNTLPPGFGVKYAMNLHFHGMGSSPLAPGDDVLGTLAQPGQKLHYVVHVPKNQGPGLYWYHPHVHGQVNFQVGEGGISGAIVVNGLEHHLPGLAKMRERLIIFRDIGISRTLKPRDPDDMSSMGSGMSDMDGMSEADPIRPHAINSDPCGPDLGLTPELNGAYHPDITIAPGEKQFFRVINAAGHKTLKLAVDGTQLELVAIDGFALDTYPGTPPTAMVPYLVVPPASRAEFVVTGPQSRFARFRTLCFDTGVGGDRDPNLELAKIKLARGHGNARLFPPGPLKVGAPLPHNFYTEALPPPSTKRVVVFSEGNKHFMINGHVFSMNAPPLFVVHTGTVEEWRISNISQEVHDFHIHQLHFVAKQIDGRNVEHPHWADSVVIPHRRADGHPGSLVLWMDFRDPIIKGTFVFHCHILDHEDHGMMAKIQAI
jgi:suppressor of ftsI